jgi:hypothetical protein
VGLHLPADSGDPGQPKTKLGRVDGSEAGSERRLLRDGAQVLSHGALICPECALPIPASGRFAAGLPLRCGFCDHLAPARDFIREDVYDTLANEVYLVARVG